MEQQAKPKKEMTAEQLEILKARLMKAREAKLTRDNKRYVANKEQIKEEGLKKRTMNKVKALVSKGAVKEEELKEILPKKEEEKKEEPKQIPINKVVDEIAKRFHLRSHYQRNGCLNQSLNHSLRLYHLKKNYQSKSLTAWGGRIQLTR
jgi:16S rRNA C967 or C1407 C5-methylase (RsmB/RsmF family)